MTRFFSHLAAVGLAAVVLFPSAASAVDYVWATDAVKATRFEDAESKEVGDVTKGQRLEVLATSGERLRVRVRGASFGWVDKAKTVDTEPVVEEELEEPAAE